MITDDNFDTDDIVDGVLLQAGGMEVDDPDVLVTWAVDSTLRYVVDWLRSTGYAAKADILETLGDI